MTRNRFEQVDQLEPDAITLSLRKGAEGDYGSIHCPAAISSGRLASDATSGELPVIDAFRSAIRLANEIKAPVVVMDPDGLWRAEWGVLYREDE